MSQVQVSNAHEDAQMDDVMSEIGAASHVAQAPQSRRDSFDAPATNHWVEVTTNMDYQSMIQKVQKLAPNNMRRSMGQMEMASTSLCSKVKHVLHGHYFEGVMAAFIFLNTIVMGVEVEYESQRGQGDLPAAFRVLDIIFTATFTLELALRHSGVARIVSLTILGG
mmetsp:Transcript_166621/g.535073  ORF Transcript_166621/g.535073 Transcript_166621/m.535073 type:complete len:166 (-) Transcript_166621:1265-1762(-)